MEYYGHHYENYCKVLHHQQGYHENEIGGETEMVGKGLVGYRKSEKKIQ